MTRRLANGFGPSGHTSAVEIAATCPPHCGRMHALLLKFGSWLVQKFAAAALIVLVALAGYGLWLFLQDEGLLDERRIEKLQHAIAERDQLIDMRVAIEKKVAGFRAEVEAQKERVREAEKVIAMLRDLESWWS